MKTKFLFQDLTLIYLQKKLKINIASLVTSLCILITGNTLAHDVTVNITGTITNTTCFVSADSIDKQVNLGHFANVFSLPVGSTSEAVGFNINLENCGVVSKGVQVAFSGTPDTDIAYYFKLDPSSYSASGFAVKLMDGNKKMISPGDKSSVYYITSGATTKSLPFYAQIVITNSAKKTGTVSSTVTFQTIYP